MGTAIYRVYRPDEYRKAGPYDLIELYPVPGQNPLFLFKWILEVLAYAISGFELIHLQRPQWLSEKFTDRRPFIWYRRTF